MDPTWGLLAKAQDDSETIEEAIERLIQAHDDDATAHLEAGQSLTSHRANTIIDHIAHSILRDKLKYDRYTIDEHFNSLDAWDKVGDNLIFGGGLWISTSGVINNYSEMMLLPHEGINDYDHLALNAYVETLLKTGSTTNQIIYIGILIPETSGVGFKIINDKVYTHYVDTELEEQNVEVVGISPINWHRFKIDASVDANVRLYIDEVLVATIAKANIEISESYFTYYIQATTAVIRSIYAMSLHYDEDFQSA